MKFKIDFFELLFLAETCIPPKPIARSMFFNRLIDEIYYLLSDDERIVIFKAITENNQFNMDNSKCREFYYRYNPDYQYIAIRKKKLNKKEKEKYLCYYHENEDRYKINETTQLIELDKWNLTKITKNSES